MATPNYGYEKRQKELAKKRKKEEKLKAKSERKHLGPGDADGQTGDEAPADGEQGGTPPTPGTPA
ncbi:hypothetical protein [Pseudorhodoferax sp. Leaf267]|uniref:hypothetical protein n=1 Tax=Pseudorhodoferax sp. Leaf267 TaxID=1736316 RepID=UPI0006F94030|nr:hypothetical protein [Pseudorhodoferax sp. Leaf267]KQP22391.1 hypothetical protein ASF43_00185 [Pseudorhodoferax sp. Leaf267]